MTKIIIASIIASASISSAATCIVQFSSGTATIATGFADSSGNAAAGLVWGIIVSNGDSSFTSLADGFVLSTTTGTGTSGSLIGGNDYYFGSNVLTANQATGGETGALGKIGQLTAITKGASAVTGSSFALVWFDRNVTSATGTLVGGTKYGLLTDPTFVIPADGVTSNLTAIFAAPNDAIKPANTFTVTGIPEPSAALLGALGVLGLLRRRRI